MPSTTFRLLGVATATALLAGFSQLPGAATPTSTRLAPQSLEQASAGLDDLDVRGVAQPSAAQKSAAAGLNAAVRWNGFGTPASISPATGNLGSASGDAATAARAWLTSHAAVFGLSAAQMKGLTLVNNQLLAGSPARAVLFRQNFGGPAPALGSQVTVGVGNGAIQYVSSSLVRTSATSVPAATLSPTAAWLKAATNVGRNRLPRLARQGHRTARLDPLQGGRVRPGAAGPAALARATPTAPSVPSSRPTSWT